MKRVCEKLLSALLCVAVLVGLIPAFTLPAYATEEQYVPFQKLNGEGTAGSPYIIETAGDLRHVSEEFYYIAKNKLGTVAQYPSSLTTNKYFSQTADIDLSEYPDWTPIGFNGTNYRFDESTYDGGGFSITGLTLDSASVSDIDENSYGLFGNVASSSVIKNVNLIAPRIVVHGGSALYSVGALVGIGASGASIYDCSVQRGSVTADSGNVGGLVGYIGGTNCNISGCFSSADVFNASGYGGATGGLIGAGSSTLTVENCYAAGDVVGGFSSGGLIGGTAASKTIITDSFAAGTVSAVATAASVHYVGGLVGNFATTAAGSDVSGNVALGAFAEAGNLAAANRLFGNAANYSYMSGGNYAYSRMLINGTVRADASESPAAGAGGLGVTAAQLRTQEFWSSTAGFNFTESGAWTWDAAGCFPKLKGFDDDKYPQYVAMPEEIASTLRITRQPVNAAVASGGTATLSVSAVADSAVSYQWQRADGVDTEGIVWTDIEGETAPALVFSAVSPEMQGQYRCVMIESGGGVSLASDAATIALKDGGQGRLSSARFVVGNTATPNVTLPLAPAFQSDITEYNVKLPAENSGNSVISYVNIYLESETDGYSWRYRWINPDGTVGLPSQNRNITADALYIRFPSSYTGNPFSAFGMIIEVVDTGTGDVCNAYTFNFLPHTVLKSLAVTGIADIIPKVAVGFNTYTSDYTVLIEPDCESVTIKPTVARAASGTVTVNSVSCNSGSEAVVQMGQLTFDENDSTKIEVVVSDSREGFVDNTYTLTVKKIQQTTTPEFITQTIADVEYVVDVPYSWSINAELKSPPILSVYASALNGVTYQWYSNTVDSTEGGTEIAGAASASYTLPLQYDETGKTYYYCIATCTGEGGQTAASKTACVTVYPDPTPTLEILTPGETLPDIQGITFAEETGYWYEIDDYDVQPLRFRISAPPEGLTYTYSVVAQSVRDPAAYKGGTGLTWSIDPDDPTVLNAMPRTGANLAGANYVSVKAQLTRSIGGSAKTYAVQTDLIYVHIANRPPDYSAIDDWKGAGKENDPFLISKRADLEALRKYVAAGLTFYDVYFKFTDNIELSSSWQSIGAFDASKYNGNYGTELLPFSGTIDGDGHTLTHAYGSLPLLRYARGATVKNLNIYGEYIAGAGLLHMYPVDYGSSGDYNSAGATITIMNCAIKSGTTTKLSGFVGSGAGSGVNTIRIIGCTVEGNVVVGYDKINDVVTDLPVGSFCGYFNGFVQDCRSFATVYGTSRVGGFVGAKGQSMGAYSIKNSVFAGDIIATGNYVGGIAGTGYNNVTAPNTPCATIQNCYVTGSITGGNYVGGIYGGEILSVQCWEKPSDIGYIQNNHFSGTITSSGTYVGGVIGYMHSINRYNIITNNYWLESSGAAKGIGGVKYIDTSHASPTAAEGVVYVNTANGKPGITGMNVGFNRDDDPIGAHADNLTKSVTAEYMASGEFVAQLNSGENSNNIWAQGANGYPVHNGAVTVYNLVLSGTYKTDYLIGESLNTSGMIITAFYTDGSKKTLTPAEVTFSGYKSNVREVQTIAVSYGGGTATYKVRVLYPETPGQPNNTTTVYFTLYGDEVHRETDKGGPTHTLAEGGLELWIAKTAYTIPSLNVTVRDIFEKALSEAGMTWVNESGNYISAIIRDGVELAEFTNGPDSGWMYTLNGTHPLFGVAEQFVKDGDEIIWHYTDDYTLEEGSDLWGPRPGGSTETNTENINDTETSLSGGGGGALGDFYTIVATETVTAETKTADGKAAATIDTQTVTEAVAKAQEAVNASTAVNAQAEIKIVAKTDSAAESISSAEVNIPAEAIKAIAAAQDLILTIESDVSTLTLDTATLATIASEAKDGDTVKIEAEAVDGSVIDLTITVGDTAIAAFGGTVTVSVPYTPEATTAAEDYDLLTVYHLADDGTTTEVKGARYDAATGKITFATTHFSKFLISEWISPFNDIAKGDWYYKAARYAYSNALITGTTDTTFAPQSTLTRAMLITILARDAGIDTSGGDTWYSKAVQWGMTNGLTDGTNMNGNITREQFATLLYRYAKWSSAGNGRPGTVAPTDADMSAYADAADISEWAQEGMAWAVANGLVTGRTATTLAPLGTANRAEAATLLQRYLENIG